MKKNLLRSLAVTTILMMLFVTSVTPAFAKGVSAITFTGVSFIPGKGYVFKFSVPKSVKTKDLPAFIRIGKHSYDLNCTFSNSTTLACSPTDSLRGYQGRAVQGAVGGVAFTTIVPKAFSWVKVCYGIFDFDQNDDWSQIGSYCQRSGTLTPTIRFYNPDYESSFTYYYYNNGDQTNCDYGAPNFGPGYYFDSPNHC